MSAAPDRPGGRRSRTGIMLFVVGLIVALGLAFFVSRFASGEPDGLNRVAIDSGFAETERTHDLDESPVAGYAVKGLNDEGLSTGLAGAIGVGVTLLMGLGLFALVGALRRRRGAGASGASVGSS